MRGTPLPVVGGLIAATGLVHGEISLEHISAAESVVFMFQQGHQEGGKSKRLESCPQVQIHGKAPKSLKSTSAPSNSALELFESSSDVV
jgi:hypothetical protein